MPKAILEFDLPEEREELRWHKETKDTFADGAKARKECIWISRPITTEETKNETTNKGE